MTIHRPEIPRGTTLNRQANWTLAIKLAAAATTYGFSILAARTMGVAGFGQVAVFLGAALFLSVLGARGQQIAILRFLPPFLHDRQSKLAQSLVTWGFRRAVLATACVFLIVLVAALLASKSGLLTGFSRSTIALGLLLIPLVGWIDYQSHVARGHLALALSLIPKEILWRAGAGMCILGAWYAYGQTELSAQFVIVVLLCTLGITTAGQLIILRHRFGVRLLARPGPIDPDWKTASGPFWVSSVSNIFLANADILAVGVFVGPEPAGYYFAANRLAMLLAFFQTSHNVVLGPALAQIWQSGGRDAVAKTLRQAAISMTLPTIFLGILLALFAPQVLSLFGGEFIQAEGPLRLLIIAGIVNAALGPGDIALNMCGFHRVAMMVNVALLGGFTIILTAGATLGGGLGVALGVLLATCLRKLVFWWLALRHMGIRSDAFALPYRQAFARMMARQ